MSNIYDMIDTWNAGGTTFTAIKMDVTDTASAAGSLLMDLQVASSSKFKVNKSGQILAQDGAFEAPSYSFAGDTTMGMYRSGTSILFARSAGAVSINTVSGALGANSVDFGAAGDTYLTRDAANVLAQRNGVNAQAFRLYNTYTDASNNEYLDIAWGSNNCEIRTKKTGTGVDRNLQIGTQGAAILYFKVNDSAVWKVAADGMFLAQTDNVFDIGALGATRPRTGYFGTSLIAPTLQTPDLTVAGLPAAAAGNKGQRRHVTDATATTYASTVVGGGANIVPVFSTGAAWIIA